MADFGIRFFLCNILICAVIGLLLMAKQALRETPDEPDAVQFMVPAAWAVGSSIPAYLSSPVFTDFLMA